MIVRFANRLSATGLTARCVFCLGLAGLAVVVPALWLMPVHRPVAVGAQLRLSHTASYGLVTWLSLDQRWREPPGYVGDPAATTEAHLQSTLQWNIHQRGVMINLLGTLGFAAVLFMAWTLMRGDSESRPCGVCGYDLRGHTHGSCPECGTPLAQLTARRLLLNREARTGHVIRAGLSLILIGAFTWILGGGLALRDAASFISESRAGTVAFTSPSWSAVMLLSMILAAVFVGATVATASIKNRRK